MIDQELAWLRTAYAAAERESESLRHQLIELRTRGDWLALAAETYLSIDDNDMSPTLRRAVEEYRELVGEQLFFEGYDGCER